MRRCPVASCPCSNWERLISKWVVDLGDVIEMAGTSGCGECVCVCVCVVNCSIRSMNVNPVSKDNAILEVGRAEGLDSASVSIPLSRIRDQWVERLGSDLTLG